MGEIWGEWGEQQDEIALHGRKQRPRQLLVLHCVQFVHQFHDGSDAGIEVPATLKVVRHALDRLVQLALYLTSFGRLRHVQFFCYRRDSSILFGLTSGMPHHKPVHTSQETLNTFYSSLLP